MRDKFHFKFAVALGWVQILAGAAVFAQTTVAPAPQIIVAPQQSSKQGAFESLIASASSFDMDSPVTAQGEFDPPVAVAGQPVIYRLEVTALEESLKAPDRLPAPAGLEFRAGGHGQTYQHTSAMKLQPRTTYLYHFTAPAAGTYSMPPFEVLAYGKPIKVPPATLTVNAKGEEREPPRLFLDLPRGDVYVGESLRLTLLMPDTPDSRMRGFSRPHIVGEFIFSEPMFMGLRREIVTLEGKTFPALIEEIIVTPLREGRQEIIAQAYTGPPNTYQLSQMLVDSDPVKLDVKPLPAQGRPPDFNGAIGIFQFDPPRVSTNIIRAGDPLTMTVTLRGEGNIGRLKPPVVPALPDWQVFPPTGESIPPGFIQQRGFANFTYPLIPLNEKVPATPSIPFSYFNPVQKAYVDLAIPSVPLTVLPGLNETNALVVETDVANNNEHEPVLTGLAMEPGHVAAGLMPLQRQAWFLGLQIVPAVVLAGLWIWDSRRRYHQQHPEVILKRRARRGLRRELRLARRAAAAGNAAGFAASTANAFREISAPGTAANPRALVCADVLRELPEPENNQSELVRRVFAAADSLRFGGPDRNGKDLLALRPDLERLLEQMKERL